MADTTFERIASDDVLVLQQIARNTFHETFEAFNTPENMHAYMSEAFSLNQLSHEIADSKTAYYFAKNNGCIAGYAKLIYDHGRDDDSVPLHVRQQTSVYIDRFYITQPFHGRGVAHEMMEFCLEKAAEHNAQHLWLGVWEKNARARAFYQKWQFAVEGQHVFCVGDDPQIDYWMVRPVKAA